VPDWGSPSKRAKYEEKREYSSESPSNIVVWNASSTYHMVYLLKVHKSV